MSAPIVATNADASPELDASCGYESIKHMAKVLKRNVKDLIVLALQNDPFYCGQPAQVEIAKWFLTLWEQFGYVTEVHLRRMHYRAVSVRAMRRNGTPYENTEDCWDEICAAGKCARTLGMVDPMAIVARF